jgi:cell division protein FtsB
MVYALYATWTVYQKKVHSEREITFAEKELLALQEKNRVMSDTIETLKTDQGVEQEIRSKFSLAKQNEHVVVIVEDSSSTPQIIPKKSFWESIKQFFSF